MASYRVLARKYRPQKFSEMIGQDALVAILSRAITQNRIPHAYILTGVRGTGKTTTARLLAKALNCVGPDGQGGPTPEPCGVCASCLALAEERHVDVVEIDAASRTGVDDVRELIETISYRPVMGRTKVYIIDEVHMLSRSAFNALLKTLEEPPENVLFVFATTEIRKIPLTILSRCQRFDLKRISLETLAHYYGTLLQTEGAEAEASALLAIAHAADGSVRDGLSILDQALSSLEAGETLSLARVQDMLGASDGRLVNALVEALCAGNRSAILETLDALNAVGMDPAQTLHDLLDRLYALLLFAEKKAAPAALAFDAAWLDQVLGATTVPAVIRLWGLLLKTVEDLAVAPDARQALTMGLMRASYVHDLPDLRQVIAFTREHIKRTSTHTSPGAGPGSSSSSIEEDKKKSL